jgi:hypothetical protein
MMHRTARRQQDIRFEDLAVSFKAGTDHSHSTFRGVLGLAVPTMRRCPELFATN